MLNAERGKKHFHLEKMQKKKMQKKKKHWLKRNVRVTLQDSTAVEKHTEQNRAEFRIERVTTVTYVPSTSHLYGRKNKPNLPSGV